MSTYSLAVCALALVAAPVSVRADADVRVLRIDGTTVEGAWRGVVDERNLIIVNETGAVRLTLDALQRITFSCGADTTEKAVGTADGGSSDEAHEGLRIMVDLADGGSLNARLIGGEDDVVILDCILDDRLKAKLDRLAGLQFTSDPKYDAASRAYLNALADRRPAEDVLITRDETPPKVLPGRLEELNDEKAEFVFGGRPRTVQIKRLYGLVLASGIAPPSSFRATFELCDGTVFSGRIEGADERRLTAETSLGTTSPLALDELRIIHLRSDRVVYLSDLPVVSERTEGMLHRPWPVRKDRSVIGGPLSIAGRTFEKGIGCHSLTELRYKLEGRYESFAATIGLDDYVRPGGAVVFRVLGDGAVLYDSGRVTGRDAPKDIVVDVTGVNDLALIVDYGAGLDLADHADWGAARLLKPATREPGVH